MGKIPWLAVLGGLVFSCASPTRASDETVDRQTLKGLSGVRLLVDDLPAEVPPHTLAKSVIQSDVESKLRKAGIPVVNSGAGVPILHVSLELLVTAVSVCPYNMTVQVEQKVLLARDAASSTVAPTWEVGSFGTVSKTNLGDLRDSVNDKIDRFINAYLSVNLPVNPQ